MRTKFVQILGRSLIAVLILLLVTIIPRISSVGLHQISILVLVVSPVTIYHRETVVYSLQIKK